MILVNFSNVILDRFSLVKLLNSKSLTNLYRQLLSFNKCSDAIPYKSFAQLKTYFNFKTRAGLWKALKKLEAIGLIKFYESNLGDKFIILRGFVLEG